MAAPDRRDIPGFRALNWTPDNIALGAPEHQADAGALARAVSWAGAEEVVAGLPEGLATPLSSRYEGGVDLSGGQWQRIALARALFAVGAGATLLVLDEPTAQLDVRAEVAFFYRFLQVTGGLTTVVISHRFSTVRRADRIVVLDGGRVVEDGTHDELLSAGGRYAEMFNLQARRFSDQEGRGGEAGGRPQTPRGVGPRGTGPRVAGPRERRPHRDRAERDGETRERADRRPVPARLRLEARQAAPGAGGAAHARRLCFRAAALAGTGPFRQRLTGPARQRGALRGVAGRSLPAGTEHATTSMSPAAEARPALSAQPRHR